MFEWFYSPVDHGWYHQNEFGLMLRESGLGHVSRLMRREWSCVRSLLCRTRRFSAAFLSQERAKLSEYRHDVRVLRRLQAAGNPASVEMAARLHFYGAVRMAVGQRVTALHPKVRHLYAGTVLTPDGDHYKIQFDIAALGVQLVQDMCVTPLLDGTTGVDLSSPDPEGQYAPEVHEGGTRAEDPSRAGDPSQVTPAIHELKLVAYIDRLLDRINLLLEELKKVESEGEQELRRLGRVLAGQYSIQDKRLVADESMPPPPVKLTAAQQRMLGEVQPPPVLPKLELIMRHLGEVAPQQALKLKADVERWVVEIFWLREEMSLTHQTLEAAFIALRPVKERYSKALTASTLEPQSGGLGHGQCAQLQEEAAARAVAIVAHLLNQKSIHRNALPSRQLSEMLSASATLLLQVQAWAHAPISPSESRFALDLALQKLQPVHDGNQARFKEVEQLMQQVQAVVCGKGSST